MNTSTISTRPDFLPEGTYWLCEEGVKVERVNMLTNEVVAHLLPCTKEQFDEGRRKARQGELMQEAFSFLTPPDREFLISGIPPLQWAELFPAPLTFSQSSIQQILLDLNPVMEQLFGGTPTQPLMINRLLKEVARDFEPLTEPERTQLEEWVQVWATQQGLVVAK